MPPTKATEAASKTLSRTLPNNKKAKETTEAASNATFALRPLDRPKSRVGGKKKQARACERDKVTDWSSFDDLDPVTMAREALEEELADAKMQKEAAQRDAIWAEMFPHWAPLPR